MKTFIITAAQNNTTPHWLAVDGLRDMIRELDATPIVIRSRYNRGTMGGYCQEESKEERWAPLGLGEIVIQDTRLKLGPNIQILGDAAVIWTARHPCNGWETFAGESSLIVPHSKMEVKFIASGSGTSPRSIHTTGAITLPNFRRSRARPYATKGHEIGALVVRVDGKRFAIHSAKWSTDLGGWMYLDRLYRDGTVTRIPPTAYVIGDLHVAHADAERFERTLANIRELRPHNVVMHDVFDGASCNPHEGRTGDIEREIYDAVHAIDRVALAAPDAIVHVLSSNHHDFLRRWAIQYRFGSTDRLDRLHARCLTALADGFDPWAVIADSAAKEPNVWYYGRGDTDPVICGVAHVHGHLGANGAKGSPLSMSKMGRQTISGHTHVPGISHGAMQVGHCSQDSHGYNVGPSAWYPCDGLQTGNLYRTLLPNLEGFSTRELFNE